MLGAWQDWLSFRLGGSWRCNRSRANFVWEQIIDRAIKAVTGMPGVRYPRANETFTFIIDAGVVAFRFKKADEEGVSANLPTQTALAFHDHQMRLPGIQASNRVEVVYQLDALETQIEDILVVARDGDHVLWHYSLLPAKTAAMPTASTPPTSPPRLRVVSDEKQDEERSENS